MRESTKIIQQALINRGYRVVREAGVDSDWLKWYSNGRATVILQEYADGHGCELYVPAALGNSTQATVDAIPTI